jgi:hypothetical protein
MIILLVIIIVLFNLFTKNSIQKNKMGFQNYYTTQWDNDLIKRFNIYQTTMNKNVIQFDLDRLQKQVSPEEANEYLKTGVWNWSEDLKKLYIEKVWDNPIIKIDPQYALNYAMKIYNQNAIRELLAWNTKEGKFLLYGGDLGVSDGMPKNIHNTIKCSDSLNMEKKVYTGMNLWNGFMNSVTTIVKPEDIPKEMPGFSFVKNACNPCIALNSPSENICPFRINIKGDDTISEPWEQLWNL